MSIAAKNIRLDYDSIKTWRVLLIVTSITIFLVLGVFYFHPSNLDWINSENFSLVNLLQFVFIDQYLIELSTTLILILIIDKYAQLFKIRHVHLSLKGLVGFFLKFIPFFFIAYFFTSIFSVNIRYLYHYFILNEAAIDYYESYFFLNKELFFVYIIPITITSLILLAIIIFYSLKKHKATDSPSLFKNILITVKSASGEKIIGSNEIEWIKREGRKYYLKSKNQKYQVNKTISELEKELDKNFMSINRSTLINIVFYKEHSFWENEKYILRMQDGQDFNITRQRLKIFKSRLEAFNQKKYTSS